jgi:uncharacterized protein
MSESLESYRRAWRERDEELARQREKRREEAFRYAKVCAETLAREFAVRRVYLFGSVLSSERFHNSSDIDLAVEGLGPGREYWKALAMLWQRLPCGLGIDLIPLEDAPPELVSRVEREGEILYHA